MQYVNFGQTGLKISRLGFGGIPIQRIDQPGTRELLIAAHKAGVNYIDTARAYTVSEAWIGQSLEEAGLRDDFILATKCRALTKADMEAELATSLKNLRTDHIEVFQFHNPSMEGLNTILAPGGAMEALLEAKARGVTRAIVSMERAAQLPKPCIFAIGNAPTALVSLEALMEADKLHPALIIGVPVGFVNVVESKERLLAVCERYGVPAIVAMGRKGGSTVAAAICNALLYSAAEMLDPTARGWK